MMKRNHLLLLLLLAACAKEKTPVALTKVRLNIGPTMTYAPLVIAKEEGFFTDEGIDAQFVGVDTSSALLALNSGDLQVFSGNIRMGMFNMMRKGLPLRIVADKGHSFAGPCSPDSFILPRAAAERVRAAGGSLRGERVSVARGGISEYLLDRLLEQRGITQKDVVFVDLPQGTSASFRQDIDAIRYMAEPHLTNLLSSGGSEVLATGEQLSPGHQSAVLVYGKRLLHDDRELGVRFMRAYLRGLRRYNEGKTPRNVEILSAHLKLPKEELLRSCWMSIASDGAIEPAAVERILDWGLKRNYLDGAIRRDQWWDSSFLDAAR